MVIVTPSFLRLKNKNKAGVFKSLRLGERSRKVPFSRRINVDGSPNRNNKAAFSTTSVVVSTWLHTFAEQEEFRMSQFSLVERRPIS